LRGRRMNAFMKQDAVVCRRISESAESRHMDPVRRWKITGLGAAVDRGDPEVRIERLGVGDALGLRQLRRRLGSVAVDLSLIEHRITPGQETTAVFVAAVLLVLRLDQSDLLPEHHCGGALTLANPCSELLPLPVGAPKARRISGTMCRDPQGQHVYTAIGLAG